MPRPGFVLDVDRSTPPLLFHHGEGFRLERLPTGSRVVYPPEPLPALADIDGAIRHALEHPVDSDPLSAARLLISTSSPCGVVPRNAIPSGSSASWL